jgi:hypothetical protein
MLSKLHDRLGTAGLVVAIVALVAALGGTAFAAAGLNGKQKKEVKKIAKKYAGKRGKAGKNGDPGAPGPVGPVGPVGSQGAPGSPGAPGDDGATGPAGSTGATGATGPEGVCSVAGCVLPEGTTETGTWAWGRTTQAVGGVYVPISFTVPLASALDKEHTHYVFPNGKEKVLVLEPSPGFEEVTSTACTGSAAEPTATPGNLCIYEKAVTSTEQIVSNGGILKAGGSGEGAATAGAYFEAQATASNARGVGTWAVTAPLTP